MLSFSLSVVALAGLMWGTVLGSTTYECSVATPIDDKLYVHASTVNIKDGCHYKSDDRGVYLFTPNMTRDAHQSTNDVAPTKKVVISIDQAVFEGTHLFVGAVLFAIKPSEKISYEHLISTPFEFKMTNSKLFGIDELVNFIGAFPYHTSITLQGNTMENLGEGTIFAVAGLNLTHESTFTFKENTITLPFKGSSADLHILDTSAVLIVEDKSKFVIEKNTFDITREKAVENKAKMLLFRFGSENKIINGSEFAIRDNTFKLTNKIATENATILYQSYAEISSESRIDLSGNTITTSQVNLEHFWTLRQFDSQKTDIECPLQLTVTGNKLDGKELSVEEVNATFNPVEIGTNCSKNSDPSGKESTGSDPSGVLHPSVMFALTLVAMVLLDM